MIKLIGQLGCYTHRHRSVELPGSSGPALNGDLDIEVRDESNSEAHYDIVKTMRASICVLGPLLAKRGKAVVSLPGVADRGPACGPARSRAAEAGGGVSLRRGQHYRNRQGPPEGDDDVLGREPGPDGAGDDQRDVGRGAGGGGDGYCRRGV